MVITEIMKNILVELKQALVKTTYQMFSEHFCDCSLHNLVDDLKPGKLDHTRSVVQSVTSPRGLDAQPLTSAKSNPIARV